MRSNGRSTICHTHSPFAVLLRYPRPRLCPNEVKWSNKNEQSRYSFRMGQSWTWQEKRLLRNGWMRRIPSVCKHVCSWIGTEIGSFRDRLGNPQAQRGIVHSRHAQETGKQRARRVTFFDVSVLVRHARARLANNGPPTHPDPGTITGIGSGGLEGCSSVANRDDL